jgi:MraZ protein
VASRSAYRGVGLQLVDDKGRVAIPSALRSSLEKNIGGEAASKEDRLITIATHESERCLIGFDLLFGDEQWQDLNGRAHAHAGPSGAMNSNIIREGIGISEDMPFDPSGRFVFPGFQRKQAGIQKYAFFYGMLNFFEIWNPQTLLDHPRMPEMMKDACRYCLDEKGIVL